ncbi:hypothetical protein ACJMK2_043250, partial [Sinanodonta woodiana]
SIFDQVFPRYETMTCIRFVPWNNSVPSLYGLSHHNYLIFIQDHGCWSVVGNIRKSGQKISCCQGTACVHEIGHALGFLHEQEVPVRDDYVRINYQNIVSGKQANFYKKAQQNSRTFGYFDMSSIMEYGLTAFTKNKQQTISVFDTDLEYLFGHQDTEEFYMFAELHNVYKCKDLKCPEFPLECLNDGYVAYVHDKCVCRCPPGLNYETGCATPLNTATWPAGRYSLLKPVSGCPPGFEEGWTRLWTNQFGRHSSLDISAQFHSAGRFGHNYLTFSYCSKTYKHHPGTESSWPQGNYCTFRFNITCPPGFQSVNERYGTLSSFYNITDVGVLPDHSFQGSMKVGMCCRSDGNAEAPISLPTHTPFILFKNNHHTCQQVNNMTLIEEHIDWDHSTFDSSVLIGRRLHSKRDDQYLTKLQYCYYTPASAASSSEDQCGDVINLSDAQKWKTFTTPNYPQNYHGTKTCTWFIKGPANSKIVLNFHDFGVYKSGSNDCAGHVEIRYSLPGQPGVKYCGNGFKKSIMSNTNMLSLTLHAAPQLTRNAFNATVTLVRESDMCYTNGAKDGSYAGKVNYGRNFETCLSWDKVTNCPHHMFNNIDVEYDLTGNYCRNPNSGLGPWCYTTAETCKRTYCDACQLLNCYDLFDDCNIWIHNNSKFCQSDEEAVRGCRKTCGLCQSIPQSGPVSSTTCDVPAVPADGVPTIRLKASYNVGEKVVFRCKSGGSDIQAITCTSDKSWTSLSYVCGTCPPGWSGHANSCYQFVDESVTKTAADKRCSQLHAGSSLTSCSSSDEADVLSRIVGDNQMTWLGGTDLQHHGQLKWDDGTVNNFSNWQGNPWSAGGDRHCLVMHVGGKWTNVRCTESHKFVCKYKPAERVICADQRPDCSLLIQRTPDLCVRYRETFALAKCAKTCGMCTDKTAGVHLSSVACRKFDFGPNITLVRNVTSLKVGQVIQYSCLQGYVLVSGDLVRMCQISGTLTGTTPKCIVQDESSTSVSNVDIRHRHLTGSKGIAYFANSTYMTIQRTGDIKRWIFYSNFDGLAVLQVWRQTSTVDQFLLVGRNIIQNTRNGRNVTVDIPRGLRIHVQPGDMIGIHYDFVHPSGISFDDCKTEYNPEGGHLFISKFAVAHVTNWVPGKTYLFRPSNACQIFSLNAIIGPRE